MSIMNNEVIVLRAKSLQNNYLKRNYKYTHNEDLAANVPSLIKQTVRVEVRFLRINRNGVHHKKSDRLVSITAKSDVFTLIIFFCFNILSNNSFKCK